MILIIFPLVVLLVLTLFSFIFSATYFSTTISSLVDTSSIINGTTTTLELGQASNTFSIDPLLGALTWVAVLVILASAIGIQVLGSGLSSISVRTIIIATAWISMFVILSLFGYPFIASIPYGFGSLLFIVLSIMYAFGIFKLIGDS